MRNKNIAKTNENFLTGIIARIKNAFYNLHIKIIPAKKNKKSSMRTKNLKKNVFVILMLLYPLLHLAVFYFAVNINSILMSFQKYAGAGEYSFIGFQNFSVVMQDLFHDPKLMTSFWNSVIMFLCGLAIGLPLNLIFSYFFTKKLPLSGIFRVILFLPSIISSLVLCLVFKMFVETPFAEVLRLMGFGNINLIQSKDYAFATMVFYGIWTGFATGIILYTSAMAKIPEELNEYGKLEGISRTREFFQVVIPLIWPTITTMLVLSMAGLFTNMGPIYAMFGDRAPEHIYTIGYYLFITVIGSKATLASYPYASTVGVVLTLVAVPITLGVKWILERFWQDVTY